MAILITTREATKLTGLSTEQLREWSIRRALIPADVKPKGHGSPAQYSWQTVLLLRFAVILRDRFKLELQAHRELFSDLRGGLSLLQFGSLWGKSLALHGSHRWSLLDTGDTLELVDDCIVLRLDPHLEVLSEAFSLSKPSRSEQFQLFSIVEIGASTAKVAGKR